MKDNNKDNSNQISEELVETSMDLAIDYSELALDTIFDGLILEEIPIIKTIVSTYKIGNSIRERHFAKKLAIFLKEFHTKEIDANKLNSFKDKFSTDHKYQSRIMEHITVFNDRFMETKKSKILANIFSAYIEDKMDWTYYLELAHCLEKLSPNTITLILTLSKQNFIIPIDDELDDSYVKGVLASAGVFGIVKDDGSLSLLGSLAHDLSIYGKINADE